MGLKVWSRAFRETDFSLQWAIGIGKESSSVTGVNKVDLFLNETLKQSNVTITNSVEDISLLNEELDQLTGMDSYGATVSGDLLKGIWTITKPTAHPENTSYDMLDRRYRMIIKNTGDNPLVITHAYASFERFYPGETFTSSTHDDGVSSGDISSFNQTLTKLGDNVEILDSLIEVFPAELVALFSGLNNTSTTADFQSIVNSSSFQNFYGNIFPQRDFARASNKVGILSDSEVILDQSLPITLLPNESMGIGLTTPLSKYFYDPLIINS